MRETIIEHLLAHTSLTQEDVAKTLAANAGIPFVRLAEVTFEPGITEAISEETAKRYRVIPVQDDGHVADHRHRRSTGFRDP